jgi:cyclase
MFGDKSLRKSKVRVIARLDIKGSNVIKGINLEGLRVVGEPNELAQSYYLDGIDEILFMDSVASLYGRNNLASIISKAANNVFVPITVGGGIRTLEDADSLLKSGADKIAINTAAIKNPNLISKLAHLYGSQCLVVSIEAKLLEDSHWEAYINNGRDTTGISVIYWAKTAQNMGAGELLITSVDREGMRRGFDLPLLKALRQEISIPIIVSGGMGKCEHLIEAAEIGGVDAIAIADVLHYKRMNIPDIKNTAYKHNIDLRMSW